MSDTAPTIIRERASLEIIDHSTVIPRKVREIDVVMVEGKVVERTDRPLAETAWQAMRRYQRREGFGGVCWRVWVAMLAWRAAVWVGRVLRGSS